MTGLIFTKSVLRSVFEHCIASHPDEACGILAGSGGRVERVYPVTNARPSPVSYEMDPEEQFRVMKDIRNSGLDMMAVYHSHPGGRAFPSSVDVERAYWPGTQLPNYPAAVHVIVSLAEGDNPVARGFMIHEGAVTEVSLTVI